MELERLIEGLSQPCAYPYAVAGAEVRQTHISVVFLAGDFVYKLKKPVKLGFLDFATLEARRSYCFEEVRLNRRLAADVYLGVVPVVLGTSGLVFEGVGEPVEWAVKMRRLPDEASFLARLQREELSKEDVEAFAERIAAFHRGADRPTGAAALGSFDAVARNARENFEEMAKDVGVTVHPAVFAALSDRTETALARLAPLIEERARRSMPCDGHGDLRLEHIYVLSDRQPPNDLVVIDCVEFSERFRVGDPVGDVAFTVMELLFYARADLARSFADAYFLALPDEEGRALLPFYIAYRSIVRAKVRGIELREREIPDLRRRASLAKAKGHCLLALGALAEPSARPLLVLVGGLPGTGKSTLARGLAARAHGEVIRSDVVRKELAGREPEQSRSDAWRAGIYTPEWTVRTYTECRRRAEDLLFEGKRVIVDATFSEEALRQSFLELARSLCVPVVWFVCQASPESVRERLSARRGDASDADWAVYERARRTWDPESHSSRAAKLDIDTDGGEARALAQALAALHGGKNST